MRPSEVVLRFKGVQVFVVLLAACLLPFIAAAWWGSRSAGAFVRPALLATLCMELSYFGWMTLLADALNSRLPHPLRRDSTLAWVGLAFASTYIALVPLALSPTSLALPWPLIPLHLAAMAANIYLLCFVGRSLVAAEQRATPPLDRVIAVVAVLWLTLFIPVGAWWVQSRARRVAFGAGSA